LASALIAACGVVEERDGAPLVPPDVSDVPDAVPRAEPLSNYGNPESYVVNGKRYFTLKSAKGFVERGIASWYGRKFHGRRTSSGETYNMYAMTAAHTRLPLPSYARVINLQNGRAVVVRVNDRGPFHDNRIIDLSYTAATKLDMLGTGTAMVELRAVDPREPEPAQIVAPVVPPRLYLQVGAFAERGNAERLRSHVTSLVDVVARVDRVVSSGRTLYRVRVGPLPDVEEADRLAMLVSSAGFESPRIVLE
jgi:rare lipoprotein A